MELELNLLVFYYHFFGGIMRGYLFIFIVFSFFLSFVGCEKSDQSFLCSLSGTVCGVDGVTYDNKCEADDAGVVVAYSGKCESPTDCASNEDCPAGFICEFLDGADVGCCVPMSNECSVASDCKGDIFIECAGAHWECQEGACVQECGFECPDVECALYCENGFKLDENGCSICECNEPVTCVTDSDCPEGFECLIVNCIDSEDITNCIGGNICVKKQLECEENSDCARGEICVEGFCKVESCVCPEIYAPVCGENGVTYGNACYAGCDNVVVVHEGECEQTNCVSDADCPDGFFCAFPDCSDDRNCLGVGFCKERVICEPINCFLFCENGFKVDENGCEICECNDVVECRSDRDCGAGLQCIDGVCINHFCPSDCRVDRDCGEGFVCQSINCLGADGLPGSVCSPIEDICYSDRDCAFGEVCMFLDYAQYGHCVSQCEPVLCDLYCENGFKVDDRGCEICECNEPQDVCYSDRDCPNGYFCEFLDGCYQDENGEIICVDYGYCVPESSECQSDRDCDYGQECLNGVCVENHSCRTDWDCETGFQCLNSVCTPINSECRSDRDCEYGQECLNGVCIQENQCEPVYCELYCENGFKVDERGCEICECNDVVEFCGGFVGQECPAGYICEYFDGADVGRCVPMSNECLSNRDCEYGQECLNGVCIENNSCIHECGSDVECGIGFTCEELDCMAPNNQSGSKCVPVEIGCIADSDCRDGESCVQNVCIPQENRCESDFDCSIGEQCMSGVCVESNSCSHECDSDSDCMGNLLGVCFPLDCQTSNGQNGSICITF